MMGFWVTHGLDIEKNTCHRTSEHNEFKRWKESEKTGTTLHHDFLRDFILSMSLHVANAQNILFAHN